MVTVHEDDRELVRLFTHVCERQERLADEYERVQAPRPQPRSVLAADDQATNPNQIGHFVAYCLLQAVDAGRVIPRMSRDRDGGIELPIMALYPVARAQIECASLAVWVMAPERRRTRVLRRLQVAHDELTHEKALTRSMLTGRTPSDQARLLRLEARRLRRHKGYLRAIAKANDIDPTEYENTFPAWNEIVQEAGEHMGIENDGLLVCWRFASGLTHPSMRRSTVALQFDQTDEDGNVLSGTLSADTRWVLGLVSIGYRAAKTAIDQWRATKIQVNGEAPVPTPVLPPRR